MLYLMIFQGWMDKNILLNSVNQDREGQYIRLRDWVGELTKVTTSSKEVELMYSCREKLLIWFQVEQTTVFILCFPAQNT